MTETPACAGAVGRPWRRPLFLLSVTALVCVLIAAVLAAISPNEGGFARQLLFSESIGLSISVWATLIGRVLPHKYGESRMELFVCTAVAIPLGYVSGHAIAHTLLGQPVQIFSLAHGRQIGILFTLIGSGVCVYFLWTRDQLARAAAARSEAQRLAAESKLRLLQAQIEPHMLFNTLANLRSLVDEDPSQAKAMIDGLIMYLRSTLAASRTESTTLGGEFAQLRAYLEIMSLRMGPRLAWQLDLPDDLQQSAVPPMLLQPLVENAIKHGLEPKVGAGNIDVRSRRTANGIEIVIADDGLGLPPEGASNGADSYGLVHVRERLKSAYGARASLTLARQTPHGVCATVRIPQ